MAAHVRLSNERESSATLRSYRLLRSDPTAPAASCVAFDGELFLVIFACSYRGFVCGIDVGGCSGAGG